MMPASAPTGVSNAPRLEPMTVAYSAPASPAGQPADNASPAAAETDLAMMAEALAEARLAAGIDEVPVGAVLVRDGRIIARAHNTRETSKCATHHAEILAIEAGCRALGGWRLPGCTLYVTLEPCPMCAGAIVNSRISRVVFAAKDPRAGAFGSVLNLNFYPLNHKPKLESGLCGIEASAQLRDFFSSLRKKRGK